MLRNDTYVTEIGSWMIYYTLKNITSLEKIARSLTVIESNKCQRNGQNKNIVCSNNRFNKRAVPTISRTFNMNIFDCF